MAAFSRPAAVSAEAEAGFDELAQRGLAAIEGGKSVAYRGGAGR